MTLCPVVWWRDSSGIYFTEVHDGPERAVRLGVSAPPDDAGIVCAWEVMKAQVGSTLIPTEAAQAWIDGLPFASQERTGRAPLSPSPPDPPAGETAT